MYDLTDRQLAQGRLDSVDALLRGVQTWLGSLPPHREAEFAHDRITLSLREGSLRGAQGDLAGAGTAYAAALAIAERLAATDPTNTTWQRDLSVSHERLANVSEQPRDRDTALQLAEQSLAVDERLVALDPTSVLWQSDLRVSRARVARLRAG